MPKRSSTRRASSGTSAHFGRLLAIGGSEDRDNEKAILSRFIDICGGKAANIMVIPAASTLHEEMRDMYDRAFRGLGAKHVHTLALHTREDANSEANATSRVRVCGTPYLSHWTSYSFQ